MVTIKSVSHSEISTGMTGYTTTPGYGGFGQDPAEVLVGKVLDDNYRVDSVLAKGGMGCILKGTHLRLKRSIAIKIPHLELSENDEFVERFQREALILAHLEHPNIVTVHDVRLANQSDAGINYLVMEFIEGKTLDEYLMQNREMLTLGDVLDIFEQIASGIDFVHEQKPEPIIHRDIKPENILIKLQDNTPRIVDFGIARAQMFASQSTMAGRRMFTPTYASPEQCHNHTVLPASDIYSLAITFYFCLCNCLPFNRSTADGYIIAHAMDKPTPLSDFNNNYPQKLTEVLEQSMAKEPQNRHRTATQLVTMMRTACGDDKSRIFGDFFQTTQMGKMYRKVITTRDSRQEDLPTLANLDLPTEKYSKVSLPKSADKHRIEEAATESVTEDKTVSDKIKEQKKRSVIGTLFWFLFSFLFFLTIVVGTIAWLYPEDLRIALEDQGINQASTYLMLIEDYQKPPAFPPIVSFELPESEIIISESIQIPIVFENSTEINLAENKVTFNVTDSASAALRVIDPNSSKPVLEFYQISGEGELSAIVSGAVAISADGSVSDSFVIGPIRVDRSIPSFSIDGPSPNMTSNQPVEFVIRWDETSEHQLSENSLKLESDEDVSGTVEIAFLKDNEATIRVQNLTGDGNAFIEIAEGVFVDEAGNSSRPYQSDSFAVDNTLPAISLSAPDLNTIQDSEVLIGISTTEGRVDEIDISLIQINGFQNTGKSITAFKENENSGLVKISDINGSGELSIRIDEGAIIDGAGNRSPASNEIVLAVQQDTSLPIVRMDSSQDFYLPVDQSNLEIPVNVSNASEQILIEDSDVILNSESGKITASINVIDRNTVNPKILLTSISGEGEARITIRDGVARNGMGTSRETSSGKLIVDRTPPSISFRQLDRSLIRERASLTLTVRDSVNANLNPDDIFVDGIEKDDYSLTIKKADDDRWNIVLSDLKGSGSFQVGLAAGQFKDKAGNQTPTFKSAPISFMNSGPLLSHGKATRQSANSISFEIIANTGVQLADKNGVQLKINGSISGYRFDILKQNDFVWLANILDIKGDGDISIASIKPGTFNSTDGIPSEELLIPSQPITIQQVPVVARVTPSPPPSPLPTVPPWSGIAGHIKTALGSGNIQTYAMVESVFDEIRSKLGELENSNLSAERIRQEQMELYQAALIAESIFRPGAAEARRTVRVSADINDLVFNLSLSEKHKLKPLTNYRNRFDQYPAEFWVEYIPTSRGEIVDLTTYASSDGFTSVADGVFSLIKTDKREWAWECLELDGTDITDHNQTLGPNYNSTLPEIHKDDSFTGLVSMEDTGVFVFTETGGLYPIGPENYDYLKNRWNNVPVLKYTPGILARKDGKEDEFLEQVIDVIHYENDELLILVWHDKDDVFRLRQAKLDSGKPSVVAIRTINGSIEEDIKPEKILYDQLTTSIYIIDSEGGIREVRSESVSDVLTIKSESSFSTFSMNRTGVFSAMKDWDNDEKNIRNNTWAPELLRRNGDLIVERQVKPETQLLQGKGDDRWTVLRDRDDDYIMTISDRGTIAFSTDRKDDSITILSPLVTIQNYQNSVRDFLK